jgi:hypothetical protein
MHAVAHAGFRKLALALIIIVGALLQSPAFAQSNIRPLPGGSPNVLLTNTLYDVEIQNGRTGRLSISSVPTRAPTASGFSGKIFGDAIRGRGEPNNGPMA